MKKTVINISCFVMFFVMALGCFNSNTKIPFVLPCNEDSICSLKEFYVDEYTGISINNSDTLKRIVSELKNSNVEIVKFGSYRNLVFYDCNDNKLFEISYTGPRFKCDGVVYLMAKDIELQHKFPRRSDTKE